MYHGGRDGSWENSEQLNDLNIWLLTMIAAMYHIDVDSTQAVPRRRKIYDSEMRDSLSFKSSPELG